LKEDFCKAHVNFFQLFVLVWVKLVKLSEIGDLFSKVVAVALFDNLFAEFSHFLRVTTICAACLLFR